MRPQVLAAAVCICLLASSMGTHAALAQTGKIGLHVAVTADDPVGKRLAFRFRDAVGRSGSFSEVSEGSKGLKATLVTLDPLKSGLMTVYSLSILIPNDDGFDYFVTSYVGVCGQDHVTACAENMLDRVGEETETLRQALSRKAGF